MAPIPPPRGHSLRAYANYITRVKLIRVQYVLMIVFISNASLLESAVYPTSRIIVNLIALYKKSALLKGQMLSAQSFISIAFHYTNLYIALS